MEVTDYELLRRYVERRDEAAFAELVGRHASSVYGAALRQTGNPHQAQEVMQAVFLLLVRKAAGMDSSVVLGAWLFRAAQFAANDLRKAHHRRSTRETPMESMPDLPAEAAGNGVAPAWEPYLPHLDRCLARLPDADRRALWLRFFEDRSLAEVGRAMGVAEDAARKRVRRALDRLQGLLKREGAGVGAEEIETMLVSRPAAMLPTGLVGATVAAVLSGGGSPVAQSLATSVARTWAWLTWKPWVIGVTAVATVTGIVEAVRTPTLVPPGSVAAALDDYAVAGFPKPEPVRATVKALQVALLQQDVPAVVALVRFPLRVNGAEGAFEVKSAAELESKWASIFTHQVTSLVLKSPAVRLYCDSRGVMVGTGEVWLGPEKDADGRITAKVMAINAR